MRVIDQSPDGASTVAPAESPLPTLRERRRLTTEREVGDAALQLFETRGVAATTVGDIARAAGISDRTFFRYFSSKEETVLDFQFWFREPTRSWLTSVRAGAARTDAPVLEQLEAVCAAVLVQLDGPLSDAADRLRRIRTLMKSEPSLRAMSATLDHERAYLLAAQIVDAFDGRVTEVEARIAAELVGLALRAACELWSSQLDAGESATLDESYRTVRGTVRSLVSPAS